MDLGFLKYFIYPLIDIVYLLSSIIPRNRYKWVFGSWFGQRFSDNSKYLFLHIVNHHPEIRAIWITRRKDIVEQLRARQKESYFFLSPRGLYHTLTAKVAVMSTDKGDINTHLLSAGHFKAQLWHGIGYKKIMYDDRITGDLHKPSTRLKHFLFPFLKPKYDMVIATSPETRRQFSGAFRLLPQQVPITGYPRNDIFFQNHQPVRRQKSVFRQLLYAPTHRQEGRGAPIRNILPDFATLNRINKKLKSLNAFLDFRLHFYDEKYLTSLDDFSHIRLSKKEDIQEVLLETDLLITDYSSIYLDYLLLDRPIIFAPFDLEEYLRSDREFHLDYHEVTPGPHARNWDEVITLIEVQLQNPEAYGRQRKKIRDLFHTYQDGNSSERVFHEIFSRIS